MATSSSWLGRPPASSELVGAAGPQAACPVIPCPFCLLEVSHDATLQEAGAAFRTEHERFCRAGLNPWAYCIRAVAWNHILTIRRVLSSPPETLAQELGVWGDQVPTEPLRAPRVPARILPDMTAAAMDAGVQLSTPPGHTSAASGSASVPQIKAFRAETLEEQRKHRWQYWAGKKTKWADYDDESQEQLHRAVQQRMPETCLKCGDYTYYIDLTAMLQTSETGSERQLRQTCS